MPRKILERYSYFPYHIYNRVNDKQFYPSNRDFIWRQYINELCYCSFALGLRIHCFVLMDNHYHLLASTPDENIDKVMLHLQREVSKKISFHTERQIYRFQGPYKWKAVKDSLHYSKVYKYILRNPIEAALCEKAEDYIYSSLHFQCGGGWLEFPIWEKSELSKNHPENIFERVDWLNMP